MRGSRSVVEVETEKLELEILAKEKSKQVLINRLQDGKRRQVKINEDRLKQQQENARRLNQFNAERRKAAEEQVAISIPVSSSLTNVDITSQLHTKFENSLIESNNIGLWSNSSSSMYINSKTQTLTPEATAQINLWQVDKNGKMLRDVILQIVRNMENYTTEIENHINQKIGDTSQVVVNTKKLIQKHTRQMKDTITHLWTTTGLVW